MSHPCQPGATTATAIQGRALSPLSAAPGYSRPPSAPRWEAWRFRLSQSVGNRHAHAIRAAAKGLAALPAGASPIAPSQLPQVTPCSTPGPAAFPCSEVSGPIMLTKSQTTRQMRPISTSNSVSSTNPPSANASTFPRPIAISDNPAQTTPRREPRPSHGNHGSLRPSEQLRHQHHPGHSINGKRRPRRPRHSNAEWLDGEGIVAATEAFFGVTTARLMPYSSYVGFRFQHRTQSR